MRQARRTGVQLIVSHLLSLEAESEKLAQERETKLAQYKVSYLRRLLLLPPSSSQHTPLCSD